MSKTVDSIKNGEEINSLFIGNVTCKNKKYEWLETIKVNKKYNLEVKLDSGVLFTNYMPTYMINI